MSFKMAFVITLAVVVGGNVAALAGLPKDYTRLEYVLSSGGAYVNTRYVHTAETAVVCDIAVEPEQENKYPGVFGSLPGASHRNAGGFVFFAPFNASTGKPGAKVAFTRFKNEETADGFVWGRRLVLKAAKGEATWQEVGGNASGRVVNRRGLVDDGKSELFIFNFNIARTPGKGEALRSRACRLKLYSFALSDAHGLRRDFVPCRAPNGAVGLFDQVENRFYGNDGLGRLLAPGDPLPAANGNSLAVISTVRPQAYDPMIFGSFLEHFHRQIYGGVFDPGSKLADADGFRTDVIAALKEIKTPIVRWPGGCFVSAYHWKDGVGKTRESVFDKAWAVEEPNTFGTDEYVKWCRKVGCEPYICTNAGTGTPEEMSDWVEYCNATFGRYARQRAANGNPAPFNVKYWSVGNENWGRHETGAKTVGEWGPFVRESAKMMLEVDKSLKLLAAATTNPGWSTPLLNAAGNCLDYVSIHNYGDPLFAYDDYRPSPYLALMARCELAERDIARMRAIITKAGFAGRVKIAYDEWNPRGWYVPGFVNLRQENNIAARDKNDTNSTYTMADAVFSACYLNAFLRNCDVVSLACFSPAVNTTGLVFVHPQGLVKRTTFHVFKLYTGNLLPLVQLCETMSVPLACGRKTASALDMVVTTDARRSRYVLAIVNKDPVHTLPLTIDFASLGRKVPASVSAKVLAGDSPDAYNDVGAENRVVPMVQTWEVAPDGQVPVPPHSVSIIQID